MKINFRISFVLLIFVYTNKANNIMAGQKRTKKTNSQAKVEFEKWLKEQKLKEQQAAVK